MLMLTDLGKGVHHSPLIHITDTVGGFNISSIPAELWMSGSIFDVLKSDFGNVDEAVAIETIIVAAPVRRIFFDDRLPVFIPLSGNTAFLLHTLGCLLFPLGCLPQGPGRFW